MNDVNGVSLDQPHLISVVIPVYGGEKTLPALLRELEPYTATMVSDSGYPFRVVEVVLVFDHGRDDSPRVLRELAAQYDFVRTVWLSRNFGQHASTLAGMASSRGEWIVTMDEDGQHDPAAIPLLLDTALAEFADVVYMKPTNKPSHGFLRNSASKGAKWLLTKLFAGSNAADYQSYRLVLGSVGRSVAAYGGAGVYLDVALGWIAARVVTAPFALRDEGERQSGYSARRLFSHFWRMVLSSGTRGLRLVSLIGAAFGVIGILVAVYILISRLLGHVDAAGWASMIVVLLVSSGTILFSLGIIAEYIGVNVNMAMGRPPYVITTDPAQGPLGRRRPS